MRSDYELHDVENADLLVQLKRLVGSSNELTAQLLAHLAEVDARGIYRDCACATLYAYCVYELRLSEDEAQRRCRAARVARQFPLLFDMLADGSIHLTGILLLAPHLTRENHDELLARARYRTKREIEKLVAVVAPWADAPSLIQPLGPASPGAASGVPARPASTWAALVHGWAGPVRQLEPGDGYGQAPAGELARASMGGDAAASGQAAASGKLRLASPSSTCPAPARENSRSSESAAPARENSLSFESAAPARENSRSSESAAPAWENGGPSGSQSLAGQRYRVQFTADQSYVELLERACDMLQHGVADRDLARVHRLAMEALVEKLSKRKYAARGTERPVATGNFGQLGTTAGTERHGAPRDAERLEANAERPGAPRAVTMSAGHVDVVEPVTAGAPGSRSCGGGAPQGRHIPSPIKRAVWERDGGRCTFTDAGGQRCRETALLEFHHREAYAKGGATDLDNVTLHCRSHNQLAAEVEFGRAFMEDKRGGALRMRARAPDEGARSG